MKVNYHELHLCWLPVLSIQTMAFGGSSGTAATLTPHTICSRRGGQLAKEVDLDTLWSYTVEVPDPCPPLQSQLITSATDCYQKSAEI